MKYLLDTNILSELMKHPAGPVTDRIREVGQEAICTSLIVIAEVEYGIEKKRSVRLRAQLDAILPSLEVLPFLPPAEKFYASARAETERRGLAMGQNDLLIAAHSMAIDAVLVSGDAAFSGVPGLKVENWLRP